MDITQGMDVEAVRGIARQLTTEATALEGVRAHVDALTSRASQEWRGQDAQQFSALWRSGARAKLVALIQGLQDLARKAAANADAQQQVSGSLDGVAANAWDLQGLPVGGALGAPESPLERLGDAAVDISEFLEGVGNTMDIAEFATLMKGAGNLGNIPGWGSTSAFLGGLGVFTGGVQLGYGVASGDSGDIIEGALNSGVAVGGLAGGPMLGVPLLVAKGFVDTTIAYTPESQDSLLDYQVERMFGVSRDNMTPEQASKLVERYEGPMGVVNTISDKMDQSGQWIADLGDKFWRSVGMKK